jgi:simple sugar transport system permease protein
LTGLAVAVAFRAGVLNIGADGQFLAGATGAVLVGAAGQGWAPAAQSWLGLPAALLAGVVLGGGWAGIAAWMRTRFAVPAVISTLMLNFVAADIVAYLVRGPLQEPSHVYPQTLELARAWHLPALIPGSRVHVGLVLAVAACIATWWVLSATAGGFRMRAVGANAWASASAGRIDVAAVSSRAFVVSGAIAGLAGAIEVTGVTFALYENISPGYGYTAIAVALLARLNALGVVITGIVFGALETGASAMQRDAGVPSVVVSVIEAMIILALVVVERVRAARRARA